MSKIMKRRGKKSILEPVADTLIVLYETKTLLDIQAWLLNEKNIQITTAGIHKFIKNRVGSPVENKSLPVQSVVENKTATPEHLNNETDKTVSAQPKNLFSSFSEKRELDYDNSPELKDILKELKDE